MDLSIEKHMIGARMVEDVREDFPLLDRMVNGKPLAYLDNAATSQKPKAVLDAIKTYYEHTNANVHRALHTLGEEATMEYEMVRRKVQRFINAKNKEEIIFTRGTTESINLVASSYADAHLAFGDTILLTEMEHHSNLVPWQLAAKKHGCKLRFIPITENGALDVEHVEQNWDPSIRLVALTHVSNVLGSINDVKLISAIAHRHGAVVLVDGAQSVPHITIDVQDIDCDFFAFSGHKMYGPMGIGVLYGKEELLNSMPPWMGGGEMIKSVHYESSTWNDLPWKFEAGTPNVEGVVGLGAAIDYIHSLGLSHISSWEHKLLSYADEHLKGVKELVQYGTSPQKSCVFAFTLGDIHAHDVAQFLDREGVAVRAGHHCAQPLAHRLGVVSTVRASLAFYNTYSEIDRLTKALEDALRFYS
jgi:cysteine desulfurase / selenocysteine lyase